MARTSKKKQEQEKQEEQKPAQEQQLTPETPAPESESSGREQTQEGNEAGKQEEQKPAQEQQLTPETPAPEKKGKTVKAAEASAEDAAVNKILQMYSEYPELYIDSKGGVFTPDTSEFVRGNAKLYKNKYHK